MISPFSLLLIAVWQQSPAFVSEREIVRWVLRGGGGGFWKRQDFQLG